MAQLSYQQPNSVRYYPVEENVTISPGDILFFSSSGTVRPASWINDQSITWNHLKDAQVAVASQFAGIAAEHSATGDTAPIAVTVSGIARYETNTSLSLALGAPIGVAKGTTDQLQNQTLTVVNSPIYAIGEVYKPTTEQQYVTILFDATRQRELAKRHLAEVGIEGGAINGPHYCITIPPYTEFKIEDITVFSSIDANADESMEFTFQTRETVPRAIFQNSILLTSSSTITNPYVPDLVTANLIITTEEEPLILEYDVTYSSGTDPSPVGNIGVTLYHYQGSNIPTDAS